MKNGMIIEGKVYELVKADDKSDCCKDCDLFKLCEIDSVKAPCRNFDDNFDKQFKLRDAK